MLGGVTALWWHGRTRVGGFLLSACQANQVLVKLVLQVIEITSWNRSFVQPGQACAKLGLDSTDRLRHTVVQLGSIPQQAMHLLKYVRTSHLHCVRACAESCRCQAVHGEHSQVHR